MKYETTRFGKIEVKNDDIIVFPEGILGFPESTDFVFIDDEKSAPFRMLQSLDNPRLAFVLIDPLFARPDYQFDVTWENLGMIRAESTDDLVVYSIVTMARNVDDVTLNLQGPIIINPKERIGCQFVLMDNEHSTRERLIQKCA